MLTHGNIWQAIDALASRNNLSASGLAKLAGLDPTTFNKSKRAAGGKLRWPSTESVAKALKAVGATLSEFVALVEHDGQGADPPARMIPLIGFAQAGAPGCFDDAGLPSGAGWEEIGFPELSDDHAYALEITDDGLLPVYRDGDRIVVSPAADLRRGDRVIVKMHAGAVMAGQLGRTTAQRVELKSFNPDGGDQSLVAGDVAFIHRIVWSSQ